MPARTTATAPPATGVAPTAPPDSKWARRAQAFGRWGVLALPVYALLAGITQRNRAAFVTDPATYAHYYRTGRFTTWELLATYGVALLGVFSLISLTALLVRGRGRRIAAVGLIFGLAGVAALMISVGSLVIRADRLRGAVFGGHWSRIAINSVAHGLGDSLVVVAGVVSLTLGWILLGVAVWRTRGMNRADGPMIMISAPMLYVGGTALHAIPTIGSFLLVAAGLGIVTQAKRAIIAVDKPIRPTKVNRSSKYSRLVGPDVYAAPDELEEFERDFGAPAASDAVGVGAATAVAPGESVGAAVDAGAVGAAPDTVGAESDVVGTASDAAASTGGATGVRAATGGASGARAATGGASGDVGVGGDIAATGAVVAGTAAARAADGRPAAGGAAPRHAERGLVGRMKATRGIPAGWLAARRRRDEAARPAPKADTTRPEAGKGPGAPAGLAAGAILDTPTHHGSTGQAVRTGADMPGRHSDPGTADASTAGARPAGSPTHAAATDTTPLAPATAPATEPPSAGRPATPPATQQPSTGAPATPKAKPKSGLMAALAAILNGSTTVSRKPTEPTPPGATGTPARPENDRNAHSSPTISTTPAGRSTTPSLGNRMPTGGPAGNAGKATNAADAAPIDKRDAAKNAKVKGKPRGKA